MAAIDLHDQILIISDCGGGLNVAALHSTCTSWLVLF